MAVTVGGVWSPDDSWVISPSTGLDAITSRMAQSVHYPEGTVTTPWRLFEATSAQTIPDNTFTGLNGFTAETGDPGATASGISHAGSAVAPDQWTVSQDGLYEVMGRVSYQYALPGHRMVQIWIDGVVHLTEGWSPYSSVGSTGTIGGAVRDIITLTAGQEITFYTLHNSGNPLDTSTGSSRARARIRRLALL